MDLSYHIVRYYRDGRTETSYGDICINAKRLNKKVKEEMRRQLLNEEKMIDSSIYKIDLKWI
jgi:hypothetical protein